MSDSPDRPSRLTSAAEVRRTLDRYLAGAATPEEERLLREWMASASPAAADHVEQLERARAQLADGARPSLDLDALAHAVETRIVADRTPIRLRIAGAPETARRSRARRLTPTLAVAAGLAIAAIGLSAVRNRSLPWDGPWGTARHYATAAGQRETVTLTDGTQLTLAPASRVDVPAHYGTGARDVYLEGEAYFAVAHDPAHPFAVHAGRATARDIGTRFGVRAYREDTAVQVVVMEGAVEVAAHVLKAHDMATVGQATTVVTHHVDDATFLAWRDGNLTFVNTPAREAVAELSRWYGLNITLANGLDRGTIDASFKDEPVADVIDAVAKALGGQAEWHGHTVTIIPAERGPSHSQR